MGETYQNKAFMLSKVAEFAILLWFSPLFLFLLVLRLPLNCQELCLPLGGGGTDTFFWQLLLFYSATETK